MGCLLRGLYTIGRIHDIGEGGMSISSEEPKQKGQIIVATLILPGGGGIVARGEILYDAKKGTQVRYGVRFLQISFDDRRRIREFVAQGNLVPLKHTT